MKKYIVKFGKKGFELLTFISPELSAKILFFYRTGKWPNLKKPKTFNEKTTYLKLYQYPNNKKVITGADKYEVRKYIKELGFEAILNELYGVYDNFDEIDFDEMPDKFALKVTNGSGYNIICSNKKKLDYKKSKKKVDKWMNEKYGYATTELHYLRIKPKIIIEKYLCDDAGNMPIDYKLYCFDGKCMGIMVCSERNESVRLNFFDKDWNELDYIIASKRSDKNIEKPMTLKQMIKIAEKISKDIPFVRVDFYENEGQIIFGELTFTPTCCCSPNYTEKGNIKLGEMLKLNKNNKEIE